MRYFIFFYRIIKILFNAKFYFVKPREKDILIYDREGSINILKYLNKKNVIILDVRKESFNFFVLFRCLKKNKISFDEYLYEYINIVKPKCIITFIDNNEKFYLIKSIFPNILTIFIQNGTRGEVGDIFGKENFNPNFKVDYMLVHGDTIGEKYESIISGKSLSIGSFKNNMIPVSNKKYHKDKKKTMLFTSTYILPPKNKNTPIWIDNGKPTFWNQFYQSEDVILPFLKNYSKKNNIKLQICGRLIKEHTLEKEYYNSYLEGCDWEFLEREDAFSSYALVDKSDILINIDSTIGYEAFGRGLKVAFFTIRGTSLNSSATKFGWPGKFPEEGLFWTNYPKVSSFERVLDYVNNIDDVSWNQVSRKYRKDIMHFDLENTKFKNLIKKIIN